MIETGRYLIGAAGASGFGSKSTAEQVTENCDLRSTTAVITGATSGIGAETARVLAKRGARLIFPARNVKSAEEAKAKIVSEFPMSEIVVMELDLSSISSVRRFVSDFESLDLPLNLLIQFDATRAYALSKLANVLHTKELSSRLQKIEANVTVNCVHPGVVRTRLTRDREGLLTDLAFFLACKLLKTVPQAAATTCYVATNPKLVNVSGKYFTDCNETTPSGLGSDSSEATKLWAASEFLVTQHSTTVFDPFT